MKDGGPQGFSNHPSFFLKNCQLISHGWNPWLRTCLQLPHNKSKRNPSSHHRQCISSYISVFDISLRIKDHHIFTIGKSFPQKKQRYFLLLLPLLNHVVDSHRFDAEHVINGGVFFPFWMFVIQKTHLFLSYFLIIIGMKLCPCAVTKILSSQTPKPTKSCLCKRATLHVHRPSSTTLPPIDKYEHCLLRT